MTNFKKQAVFLIFFIMLFVAISVNNVLAESIENLSLDDIKYYVEHGRLPMKHTYTPPPPPPYIPPYEQLPKVSVKINGAPLISEISAVVWGETTFIPLKSLAEVLGAQTVWFDDNYVQSIKMTKGNLCARTGVNVNNPGVNIAYKNENDPAVYEGDDDYSEYIALEHTAFIVNERVMVPLKAFTEPFGYSVLWDEGTSTINVNKLAKFKTYMSEEEAIDITMQLLEINSDQRPGFSVVDIVPDKYIKYPPGSLIVLDSRDTKLSYSYYYVVKKNVYENIYTILDQWIVSKNGIEIHNVNAPISSRINT